MVGFDEPPPIPHPNKLLLKNKPNKKTKLKIVFMITPL
jgi:hypothetical protein